MKKLILFICLTFMISSCTLVIFDNVNNYNGSIILKIVDNTDNSSIKTTTLYIKTIDGDYTKLKLDTEFSEIFHVGDTI